MTSTSKISLYDSSQGYFQRNNTQGYFQRKNSQGYFQTQISIHYNTIGNILFFLQVQIGAKRVIVKSHITVIVN